MNLRQLTVAAIAAASVALSTAPAEAFWGHHHHRPAVAYSPVVVGSPVVAAPIVAAPVVAAPVIAASPIVVGRPVVVRRPWLRPAPVVVGYAPAPTTAYSVAPAAYASPTNTFYAPQPTITSYAPAPVVIPAQVMPARVVVPAPVILVPWRQF